MRVSDLRELDVSMGWMRWSYTYCEALLDVLREALALDLSEGSIVSDLLYNLFTDVNRCGRR
jgi:hypothetical protein